MSGMLGKHANANFGFGVVPGFDSTGQAAQRAVERLSKAEQHEVRSLIEEARSLAFFIVGALIVAITEKGLEENELPSDRLDDLMLDAVGDADEEDGEFWSLLEGAVSDAFESLGVDETTIADLFSDNVELADTAIESAAQTALANLPDDGEPMDEFVREFVYGEPDDEAGFDAAKKPSAGALKIRTVGGKKISYRGTVLIRNGKRTIVNKRLPNQKIRLTVKQRANLKKLKVHAMRANSVRKRTISFKKGKKLGLY